MMVGALLESPNIRIQLYTNEDNLETILAHVQVGYDSISLILVAFRLIC